MLLQKRVSALALVCAATVWVGWAVCAPAVGYAAAVSGVPASASSSPTSSTNGTPAVPASSSLSAALAADVAPFGANLFQGNFARDKTGSAVQTGDRIVVRMWGNHSFDGVLTVDAEGNILLPDFGLVPLSGLPYEQLEPALRSKISASGGQDTQLYVAALDVRPLSLFVTGHVPRPGNYSGAASDTVLAFLDRAGGIDAKRGSYRSVRLMRKGEQIDIFDLYPFALKGQIAYTRLQDGDTIVVEEKGPSVIASGEVRNTARFEFKPGDVTGTQLMTLADPLPRATHVSLSGSRRGAPYNQYLPVREFRSLRLENGDQVRFLADTPGDTIMIEAQGAIRGASRFPVRRNASLRDVSNYIAVDPDRANLAGLYIRRKSVAERQKRAIEDALRRLEQNAYTATSSSPDEAQIRAKEAEMLTNFVSRAREVQPEGIVVVGNQGMTADLGLEDGDVIVIPEKNDVVLISGEVMMPQAIVWDKDKSMRDYIRGAGGYTNRADSSSLIVVRPSGEVFPGASDVHPGDQVMVMPKIESKSLQSIKDVSQVLYQVAVACKVVLDFYY